MNRGLIAAVCVCLFGFVWDAGAAEKKGKFVKYDKEAKALTIKGEDGEATFTLTEETRVVTAKGNATKFTIGSFGDPTIAKAGALLAVVFEEKDGKVVKVTEIKLGGREKK
jgi:hypothetical protein